MNPIDIYFDLIKQAKENEEAEEKKEEVVEEPVEVKETGKTVALLNQYLGFLRALAIIHQHGHWKCACEQFYGNHLLLERLYDSAQKLIDGTAEKIIGLFGNKALIHSRQADIISSVVSKYVSDDHLENSLKACNDFLSLSNEVYKTIKQEDKMSMGLDDMIMAHHSKIETAIYLLRQASSK